MQPLSREQLNRNRYLRTTSFEGKSDTGDKFRRAKGDSYPRNRPTNTTATMAPNDDAGEDTYRGTPFSSPITVIAATTPSPLPMSALDASETLLDDISNCSSPPTHPAFFPSAKREAGRGGGVGKENIPCQATPTSVAKVSFSPLSSPLAALMARKSASPKQRQKIAVGGGRGGGAAAAGPVMLGRFLDGVHKDDGGGNDPGVGDGWDRMEVVLGNVDTNILAPRPNENNDTNGGHFEAVSWDLNSRFRSCLRARTQTKGLFAGRTMCLRRARRTNARSSRRTGRMARTAPIRPATRRNICRRRRRRMLML